MRRLGQHFLKNKAAIEKIIDALEVKPGDTIVEIGAGHGELTTELRTENVEPRVIAIERDKKLADGLERKVAKLGNINVEVVCDDALKFLKSTPQSYVLGPKSYKIVGNIPYYLTGRLLRVLSELDNKPKVCVFTIQKEVAERICAHAKKVDCNIREMNPTHNFVMCGMNRLAAIVQFWAEPKILKILPPEDFDPKPGVESAIIKLGVRNRVPGVGNREPEIFDLDYYKTVRALFGQPRKTILNNLTTSNIGHGTWTKDTLQEKLRKIGTDPNDRPQNLSVEEIERIAKVCITC